MTMDETRVVEPARQICQTGFDHDWDFDSWGTNPKQEENNN